MLHLPRGVRAHLLLTLAAVLAVALAVMVAGFNLLLEQRQDADASDLVRGRAEAALAAVEVVGGELHVEPLDQPVWVFDARGRTLRSAPGGAAEQATARSLAGGPARTLDVPGGAELRLAAAPIAAADGRRAGTLVASLGLETYERSERYALVASIALALLLFGGMLLAARWLLQRALAPVVEMTQLAEEWSANDPGRRFALGQPHDELTELAATLDRLLDRIAASLRHEQRFSAELSHELRTPLARIAAETELALRRERAPEDYRDALASVQRNALELTRTVDALVAAARHEGGPRGRADVVAVTRTVAAAAAPLVAARSVDIAVEAPQAKLIAGVEAELLERILAPVVENACRYATAGVRLGVARAGPRVVVDVRDDGPGVPAGERERIFEPGARGAEAGDHDGAGLGLALARRLARAADGDVRAQPSRAGGWFTVDLPAA